jgi:DAK2 domain fusion protein YloV
MRLELIDGNKLKEMFYASAQMLEKNKQKVNSLNVFPVPDGDTGTNMCLTMMSAIKEVKALTNGNITQVAEAMSRGSLKGARGNSGVILSQIFRGFAKGLKGEQVINTRKYAEALKSGADTSYKAVIKPVEGTMLTVARVTAEEAEKIAQQCTDFNVFFKEIIKVAKRVLDKTPDMLAVLKQAGVVDAGGMGLLFIMLGAANALKEDFDQDFDLPQAEAEIIDKPELDFSQEGLEEIGEGYCTEFLIKNVFSHIREEDLGKLQAKLEKLGDSLVLVNDDDMIKVHIHTNAPGKILQLGLRFGELSGIKIDNMREQHRHLSGVESSVETKKPQKRYGVVSVASGEGIVSIFKDMGADKIVEGGQTMNPSIEDIMRAVDAIDADEVFILPNNSNIILSATQVKQLSRRKIQVIPSKSIPQGISAMVAFNPELDSKTNSDKMLSAIGSVNTGLVTYAVRDSSINGISIKNGDILGILESGIEVAGTDVSQVTKDLINKIVNDDCSVISIYYGQEVSENDADDVAEYIETNYPYLEVELYFGGQPLYYYIISLE